MVSYAALTSGAVGPDPGGVVAPPSPAPVVQASLSYSGGDLTITGSVDHIFETAGFVGPNRLEKQDRPRISVDVASFSDEFSSTRTRLAALRAAPNEPKGDVETRLAAAGLLTPKADETKVALASVGTSPSTSALDAIDHAAAPDSIVPMPAEASTQLAYARETAPVTSLDATKPSTKVSAKELWCLATAVYFEARGEIYRGQAAVAQVVMNRTQHKLYPDTICGVVFQNQHKRNACQFSFACDGHPETVSDRKAWAQAEEIAKKVVDGELYLSEVGNATHYHATYVYPHWAPRMNKVTKIGLHVFYRFKSGWRFG